MGLDKRAWAKEAQGAQGACEVARLRKNVSRFAEPRKSQRGSGACEGKGCLRGEGRLGMGPDRLKQRLGIKLVEFLKKKKTKKSAANSRLYA